MADNTQLSAAVGSGDTLRTEDRTTFKTPVSLIDVGGSAGEALIGDASNSMPINDGGNSITVDGTFWQDTQPVSGTVAFSNTTIAVTNAGTFATQAAQSGTWNITNISGTVSLPTGAATAAKQPALGTAGTASADVITVQGIASMTALKVDGSAVTQPVSGTFWQATQPVSVASIPSHEVTNAGTFAVQVSSAIPAGTNNIGDVDVLSVPSDPFGANADAASATGSISAKLRFIASTGIPITGTVTVGSHAVTNAGTFVVQVDGTALTRLTDIETNTATLAVVGNGAAATAQRVTLANDSTGVLGTVSTVTTVSTLTGGGIAHDSADSGNPHKVGTKAAATLSTATLVSADDRANAVSDLDGALVVREHNTLGDVVSGVAAITDGSSTSVIASSGAGVKTYITDVVIANSSATNVTVDLRDGTGGSVKATFPVPANGGVVHSFKTPLAFSAATAVAADPSAAASTVTVTISGFKSKV